MADDMDDELPRYLVEFTEPALIEADAAYLNLSTQRGPDYAILWYEGLFLAAQTLSTLPRSHAIAPENDAYGVEVRRLLYSGPSRRSSGRAYRILFYVIEPAEDEEEGTVRILHVWHGAKSPAE